MLLKRLFIIFFNDMDISDDHKSKEINGEKKTVIGKEIKPNIQGFMLGYTELLEQQKIINVLVVNKLKIGVTKQENMKIWMTILRCVGNVIDNMI